MLWTPREKRIVEPTMAECQSLGLGLGFGGGAANLSARSISGLTAWWRADLGVTIATGASAWADQSGTGDSNKNLSQGTGSKQPTRTLADAAYNNRATLAFASASLQYMASGTWAAALAQPFTWFIVGNDDGSVTSQVYMEGDTSGVNRSLMYQNGTGYELFCGTSRSGGARSSAPRILVGVANGVSSAIYVSARTPVATGDAGSNGVTAITMGAAYVPSTYLNGKVAEAGVYNRVLNSTEVATLLATILGPYYGISIGA